MEKKHKPCKHRRRETINGVELDMCYAIGFECIGDMPCEYCNEWEDKDGKVKKPKIETPEDSNKA